MHARLRGELRERQRHADPHDRVLVLRAEVATHVDRPGAVGVDALAQIDEELRRAGARRGDALGHRLPCRVGQRQVVIELVDPHVAEGGIRHERLDRPGGRGHLKPVGAIVGDAAHRGGGGEECPVVGAQDAVVAIPLHPLVGHLLNDAARPGRPPPWRRRSRIPIARTAGRASCRTCRASGRRSPAGPT